MKIVFQNLDRSDLIIAVVRERLDSPLGKFRLWHGDACTVTVAMHNSPLQAGPDLFSVKVACLRGPYRGLVIEKRAPQLYAALAEVRDTLHERLGRFAARQTTRKRRAARALRAIPQGGDHEKNSA